MQLYSCYNPQLHSDKNVDTGKSRANGHLESTEFVRYSVESEI